MHKNVQKTIIVGDKWVYYKIYCGVNTADIILTSIIKPFTEQLLVNKYIDKWFFIRYSDPEPHLRVRFLIKDLQNIGLILIKFHKTIVPFIKAKQIWNVQLDTYKRETERYGANTIELAESFFFYDSKEVVNIIKNSENDEIRFLTLLHWYE
jgi:thiopeptide-type bacteriocin biosynthesis protein